MSAPFTAAAFQEFVHTDFHVWDDPANVIRLTLIQVVEQAKTPQHENFSLVFFSAANSFMPQAIHKLKHSQLGELDLFLVPVARVQDGFHYEAVFNNPTQ